MKVVAFHHVSVNTRDAALDDVVNFYGKVLGLGDAARPDLGIAGHWHDVGDQQLHLVAAPMRDNGIDPVGPHFCVTVDDLDGAVAELEASGIEYLRVGDNAATAQVWITDPAGNTIELQQHAV
jgi:catechol 2,3-dioxygenase-like lactoylglutathione lyase family enzyme